MMSPPGEGDVSTWEADVREVLGAEGTVNQLYEVVELARDSRTANREGSNEVTRCRARPGKSLMAEDVCPRRSSRTCRALLREAVPYGSSVQAGARLARIDRAHVDRGRRAAWQAKARIDDIVASSPR